MRASLVRPFEFTCGVPRICSVCCTHAWFVFGVARKQYAQAILGGEPPFHNGVIGALPLPFGWLPTAQCIEGIRRSAVIGLCRPMWRPLASAEEGADSLSAGQSVSAGGVTRAKRAVSEVFVGTPVPVDYPCIDGRPLFQQLPRQPSQRSRPAPHAKKKSFSDFFPTSHRHIPRQSTSSQRLYLYDAVACSPAPVLCSPPWALSLIHI